jgi:hypothetical protein
MYGCVMVQVEEICRKALYRRYRLLPHFYTLFYRAHTIGLPVMTPLFFAGISPCMSVVVMVLGKGKLWVSADISTPPVFHGLCERKKVGIQRSAQL